MRNIEKAISDRIITNKDEILQTKKNILVLGVGNFLMGDEGVGVHFIHELIKRDINYENADILDGGVGGFALMSYFDQYDHVIFIDATMDGKLNGTISLIEPKFASDFPQAISAHDFGLKDMIESMYLLGKVPKLYLFTVSIPSIKPMTLELSPAVRGAIPELIKKVGALVKKIDKIELIIQ